MDIIEDEEILKDFLVEASEILELLGEQLVELEQSPEDQELLNAVFRGFHTIKGGAGFLEITALIEVCHRAEDVFNLLRQGERKVDAHLMDVILRVHDSLNEMFETVQQGNMPEPADPALLALLEQLQSGKPAEAATEVTEKIEPVEKTSDAGTAEGPAQASNGDSSSNNGEITDEEFENLLNQLHGTSAPGGNSDDGNEIDETEFEALLDNLHGSKAPGFDASATSGNNNVVQQEVQAPAKETQDPPAVVDTEQSSKAKAVDAEKKSKPPADTTVRVDTQRLDDIMNLVGELVLVRNRLMTIEVAKENEDMAKAVANLDLVTADLQTSVMKTRMQPIKKVFGRFPRVVRDLARSLNKEISLEMVGEDTDLDKNLVEALADPLVHLVRNSVDHGIEMPDERVASGKSPVGKIVLSAEQEGDHILLSITDDGAGIDANRLRNIAIEKKLLDKDAASRLDKRDCFNLIFLPGFSTKENISDISGRGVGMDVVKTRITQLNGSIDIDSELGKGSRIAIKVPLTLAIMPTLMVVVGNQVFALPLVSVIEIFHLDLTKTNMVDGQLVVIIREKPLPLIYLKKWLVNNCQGDEQPEKGHVVVVHVGNRHIGFVVDKLIGQEEVVIKPLGALLHGTKGLAGATVTGDGRISLILDVPGLVANFANRY